MKAKFKKSEIKIVGSIMILDKNHSGDDPIDEIYIGDSKGKTKSGVYLLRNKLHPERYYIGMARNLESRYSHHISDLRLGKHINKLLQKELMETLDELMCENEHDVFDIDDIYEMEVIIYCRPSLLTFYENILINSLNPYYNQHKVKSQEFDRREITQEMIENQADRFNREMNTDLLNECTSGIHFTDSEKYVMNSIDVNEWSE